MSLFWSTKQVSYKGACDRSKTGTQRS